MVHNHELKHLHFTTASAGSRGQKRTPLLDRTHCKKHNVCATRRRSNAILRSRISQKAQCAPPARKSVGYFGAVRLRDGKFFYRRETGKFNGVTCWQVLKDLRAASIRTARRVVVITDNAKYHHARLHGDWRRQAAKRFALDFLPPYSPELNPTERLWKLTRRLFLHNRYFSTLEEVTLAVENEFANWTKPNNTLRRLCVIN